MEKFSSINGFRYVVKTVQSYYERIQQPDKIPILHFIGTVKLHGTNTGICRKNGKFYPQSRNRVLDVNDDNYGFAAFVTSIPEDELNNLFDLVSSNLNDEITLYGEWIGPGIQSNVGVSKLPNRQWVIFSARVNNEYIPNKATWCLYDHHIYNILEAGVYRVKVDFKNPAAALSDLEKRTLEVEATCPWAYTFGINGIGEGIVWTCEERPFDSDLWFKTKGEKHSGKNKSSKKIATINPQLVKSVNQCVDIILPEERLNQGLEILKEQKLELEMENLGAYLRWIGQDVKKEESDTIKANNLEWKDVSKEITVRAKQFFERQIKI